MYDPSRYESRISTVWRYFALRNINILKLKNISFMQRNVRISGHIPMDWYTQPFMPLYNWHSKLFYVNNGGKVESILVSVSFLWCLMLRAYGLILWSLFYLLWNIFNFRFVRQLWMADLWIVLKSVSPMIQGYVHHLFPLPCVCVCSCEKSDIFGLKEIAKRLQMLISTLWDIICSWESSIDIL